MLGCQHDGETHNVPYHYYYYYYYKEAEGVVDVEASVKKARTQKLALHQRPRLLLSLLARREKGERGWGRKNVQVLKNQLKGM